MNTAEIILLVLVVLEAMAILVCYGAWCWSERENRELSRQLANERRIIAEENAASSSNDHKDESAPNPCGLERPTFSTSDCTPTLSTPPSKQTVEVKQ